MIDAAHLGRLINSELEGMHAHWLSMSLGASAVEDAQAGSTISLLVTYLRAQ